MEQVYWQNFWKTGNVNEYLSYKNESSTVVYAQKMEENTGVSCGESDCADGNGAVYSTSW